MAIRTKLHRRFANAEHFETDQPGVYQADFYPHDRWVRDLAGQYKTYVERDAQGDLDIDCATVRVRGARSISAFQIGPSMRKFLRVDRFVSGAWEELPLTLAGHAAEQQAEDLGVWRWRYELPNGTDVLGARLRVQPGRSKWDYAFRAPQAGQYRFRIQIQVQGATEFEQHVTKGTAQPYQVYWTTPSGIVAYNWRDMLAAVAGVQVDVSGMALVSNAVTLAVNEVVTLDPTVGPLASSWGADVHSSQKFPLDGSDWCGGDGGSSYRVANKWNISSIVPGATVTQVDTSINVSAVAGAGSLLWDVGCYGSNGQGTPEFDTASTMYTNCAPGNVYLNDITDFRTTGVKTFTDLGSQANSDVQAARSAGNSFALAYRETTDTTSNAQTQFSEFNDATNPPKLTVTYTFTGTTATFTINATNLDGHEESDTTWYHDGYDTDGWRLGRHDLVLKTGLIFPSVTIPKNATIKYAFVEAFSKFRSTTGVTTITWKGIAEDNCAVWQSDGSNRPSTRSFGATTIDDTLPEHIADEAWYSFRDITAIVQAIVDRSGWSSGNNLGIVVTSRAGSGDDANRFQFQDYGRESTQGAKLHVGYTESTNYTRTLADQLDVNDAISSTLTPSIRFGAVSESHTGTTGSTSEASFSWTHGGGAYVKGVVVGVVSIGTGGGLATAVTYGGQSLAAISGGEATDTTGEPATVQTFFLGSGLSTGNQTVVVTRTNNARACYAVCISVIAPGDTKTSGTPVLLQNDGTYTEQAVDAGTDLAVRLAFGYSGGANVLGMGASTTTTGASGQIDFGAYTFTTGYETTPGTGSRSVGFSFGTSDDRAGVHLAIAEQTGGQIYTRTLSDSINVQDSPVRRANLSRRNEDAITLLDFIVRGQRHGRVAIDNIALIDAVRRGQLHGRVTSDAVTVLDAASRYLKTYREIVDTIDVTDATQRFALFYRLSLVDVVNLNDSTSRTQVIGRNTFDSLVISDVLARGQVHGRVTADPVDVIDRALRFAQVYRLLNDSVEITDLLSRTITEAAGSLTRVLRDQVGLTDVLQRSTLLNRLGLSDAVDLNDAAVRGVSAYRQLTDAATVTDATTRMQMYGRVLVDAMAVADNLIRSQLHGRTLADPVDVVDAAIRYALFERLLDDSVEVNDSLISTWTAFLEAVIDILMTVEQEPIVLILGAAQPIEMTLLRLPNVVRTLQ